MSFLKSGGSEFPIKSLCKAGVDMRTEEPVRKAAERFGTLLSEFRRIRGI